MQAAKEGGIAQQNLQVDQVLHEAVLRFQTI